MPRHFISLLLLLVSTAASRRLLHQPFFPTNTIISQPPLSSPIISPQPQPQPGPLYPKYPFSSTTQNPFFPFYPSPPPPPPPPPPSSATAFSTFPANISSLVLPSSSHSPHKPSKLIPLILSLSLFSILISASLLLLLLRRRHHNHHLRLDTDKKPPPPLFPHRRPPPSSASTEFLDLGTLVSSRDPDHRVGPTTTAANDPAGPGSPELQPLPPLPRQHSSNNAALQEDEEDEFFSPRGSTGNNNNNRTYSPVFSISPDNCPSPLAPNTDSPQSMLTKSPDSSLIFPPPFLPRFAPPPPPPLRPFSVFSPSSTDDGGFGTRDCSPRASDFGKTPPPPPTGPPELVAPGRKVVSGEKGSFGNSESKETMKPKLKPLHWDKVRATSDRAMVWDQLKSSSFQLNEEMIETLFTVNSSNVNAKDGVRRQIVPEANQENLVLDPKKSQNIAILLRALNVTVDEVCEALVEGNADTLGTELLESLLKMRPTKEEERKLKEFKDESPLKLGTAETFLKAVLNIPFAFKRVEAMLYIANFDLEIEHLKRSFDTLGSACKELKSSRMFQKLLEAVLKTGNRMNIGTHRGEAHAFKLDTLLKLVDVKGADGKTTLLHFVVQEIIKAEGARCSGVNQNPNPEKTHQSTLRDEVEFKKLGLQVVSGLSGELSNVKKAAAIDADVLINDVSNLAVGISKVNEVLKLNDKLCSDMSVKFSDNMSEFLKKAEGNIMDIQAGEGIAFSMVKGLTEYFHGKEEARPLRLFMVVRDLLSILDRVCKDVGKINERTMVNSGRQIQTSADNESIPQVFLGLSERLQSSSSDDESSSSF